MATAEPAAGTTLHISRVIDAPRERVFHAWTDPELVPQWFGVRVPRASAAELDLRVGGTFRIGGKNPLGGGGWRCVGTYLEVVPPERLVYTFGWEGRGLSNMGESLVTVEFRDRGDTTEIVLTHERNPTRGVRAYHSFGWRSSLKRLAEVTRR